MYVRLLMSVKPQGKYKRDEDRLGVHHEPLARLNDTEEDVISAEVPRSTSREPPVEPRVRGGSCRPATLLCFRSFTVNE